MRAIAGFAGVVAVVYAAIAAAAAPAAPAKPDLARGQQLATTVCAACHGANGVSPAPANPHIAGQSGDYIAAQLEAFKSGTRANPIMEISAEDYEEVMDVNLRGTLYMSQALIPHFRERRSGVIVCLASVAALRGGGLFGGPHYAASKGGVLALAKSMARELAPDGIRVNAIAPSMIDTDIFQGQLSAERREQVRQSIPMGRLGRAGDVAGVCLFLASDLSSYVTGAVIDVNGGSHIH